MKQKLTEAKTRPQKRNQRDYSMGFKLSVISQVEKGDLTYKQAQDRYGIQGRSTVLCWLRKHGNLDWSKPSLHFMSSPKSKETPAQQIKRLEKSFCPNSPVLPPRKISKYFSVVSIVWDQQTSSVSISKKKARTHGVFG